jgi:uncharacterized lipoprotein YajG
MKKIIAVVFGTLLLTGCATVSSVFDTVTFGAFAEEVAVVEAPAEVSVVVETTTAE